MKARAKRPAARKAPPKKQAAPAAKQRGRVAGPKDKDLETVLHEVTAEPKTEHIEQFVSVACPYCGEEFEIHATSESDGQTQYEDCHVCCRPIAVHFRVEDGEIQIDAHRS